MWNVFLSVNLINFLIKTLLKFEGVLYLFLFNLFLKFDFESVHFIGKCNIYNNGVHSKNPNRKLREFQLRANWRCHRYSISYLIIIISICFWGNAQTHVIINSMPTRNFHKRIRIDERVHDYENIYEKWPEFFLKGWVVVENHQVNVLKWQQNISKLIKRCVYSIHTLKIMLKSKLICMAFGKKFLKNITHQQIVWGNGP